MDVLSPGSLAEALALKAERPDALPIAGGTDLMVELNFDRRRPDAMLDVSRLPELGRLARDDGGGVFVGAGVTFTRVLRELPDLVAFVQAARTVGSPQIRNRGTLGGNLGTASPAGDALPVLAAVDADVVLVSAARGERRVPWDAFLVGPKRTTLEPDELILGAAWRPPRGPGSFSKVGTRNAMVISVAGLCLQVDEDERSVAVALGSVAPTVVRAREAEEFAAGALFEAGTWTDSAARPDDASLARFGELVAAAASPIDDVRGTAAYRRHACAVLGRRALDWALRDRRLRDEGPGTDGPAAKRIA